MENKPILYTYTIYFNPSDYPGQYVVREWSVGQSGAEPGLVVGIAKNLDIARAFIPFGLVRMCRHDSDDPVIVETWI